MLPRQPKFDIGLFYSLSLKLLQLAIVAVSLTLLGFSLTYLISSSIPPAQVFFLFAIPLLWILPIYFIVTFVSPILLLCRSRYGQRPSWLSPGERCVALALPAFVTFALAIYFLVAIVGNESYSYLLWTALPYICLALSSLVFIETLCTFQLDKRSKPQQSEPVGCGKSLCLFQCASSIAHQTPPGILNYNTCCSSIRLIRNINAFGAIVGVVIVLNIIALFIPFSSSAGEGRVYISTSLAIAAHVLTFLFWLGFIVGASRAVTSFRAQLKLAYLDALLAVLLLVWNVFNASESLDNYCRGGFCTFWVGYAFWGTLFSITALTVDVLTIIFCKRQLRTTSTETYPLEAMQKYELPSQQPGRSPDTVVDLANSNVANYPLSDGKIEA